MSYLEVTVLGLNKISLDGKLINGFKTSKARALLTYLMVEQDQPHLRETLAGIFWPDLPDSIALSNLRDALSNLRQLIGDKEGEQLHQGDNGKSSDQPYLIVTRSTIQFNSSSKYWLDLRELYKSISSSESIERLEQAVTFYKGHFGEGLLFKKSTAFDEWILVKREQINQLVLTAFRNLAKAYEARCDHRKVIEYARKQLEIEPWLEEAHRQLMRSHALVGERNQALMQYEVCRKILWDELVIEPDNETTRLYQSIRNGSFDEKGSSLEHLNQDHQKEFDDSKPSPCAARPSFVAREKEMSALHDHLKVVLSGNGKAVFITGDAGSGKTALAFEFGRKAMDDYDDLIPVYGRCSGNSEIGDIYLPYIEIFQQLCSCNENRRNTKILSDEHQKRLSSLFPTAAQALIENGPGLIGSLISAKDLYKRLEKTQKDHSPWWKRLDDLVRSRIDTSQLSGSSKLAYQTDVFGQITRVLQHISITHPLLIILDDLQWADAGTINLLFHLGRRLEGNRILILCIYRVNDLVMINSTSHPLEWVINEFQREFGDDPINLDLANGRDFVRTYVDSEPNHFSSEFCDLLYSYTNGNPLFTVELVRGLQERGDIIKDQLGNWVESGKLDWDKLPRRVEAAIAERFRHIPETWISALRTGAVEGNVFTAE